MSDSPESSNEKDYNEVSSAPLTDNEVGTTKDVSGDDELLAAIGYKQVCNLDLIAGQTIAQMISRNSEESSHDGRHYHMLSPLWECWDRSQQLMLFRCPREGRRQPFGLGLQAPSCP